MTPKLPRQRILRGRGAFADVLARGNSVAVGSVKLFFAPAPPPDQPKVGFTVLRGVKNAAARNRIKRCMREAFRLQQHLAPRKPGSTILMYVGKSPRRSSEIDCTKIKQDVLAVLNKLTRKTR